MSIQVELIKRYRYLNENKELILSMCIIYKIDREHIKSQIKRLKAGLKKLNKNDKNEELLELINKAISICNADLKTPKAYLSSNPSREYVDMLEEFLLGDVNIEETVLFKEIEYMKENEDSLMMVEKKIIDLEDRRKSNEHLKKMPTFTVWKILSYVQKRYQNNTVVQSALDKYYNLERWTISNHVCQYGYYIDEDIYEEYPKTSLYASAAGDCVEFRYHGNEFEEEDNYYETKNEMNDAPASYYPSEFANDLARTQIVQNKEILLKSNIGQVLE